MRVPIALYGLAKDVKSGCRKAITAFRRGGTWTEVFGELIDSRALAGLFALDGPSYSLGGKPHFQMYQPIRELDHAMGEGRILPAQMTAAFAASLKEPWGLLTLMGPISGRFFQESPQRRAFVEDMARAWDVLDAEGARYSVGLNTGGTLWEQPTMLHYALANEGLPKAVLDAPLPPGGLPALLEQLRWGSQESGLKRLN
jgi:hypothetical protein